MNSSKPRNRSRSPVRRSNERSHHTGSADAKKERHNTKDKASKSQEELPKTPISDGKPKNSDTRNESNNKHDSKENPTNSHTTPKQAYVSTSSRTYVNPVTGKMERKFSNRCRLFVGNIIDMTEEEFKKMFEKYGEYSEAYVNKEKAFGFIKMVSFLLSVSMNTC